MRVAFDIDGVLRDLMAAYVPHVERSVEELDVYDRAIEFAGGVEQFYEIMDGRDCWRTASPYPAILALYRQIANAGHTLILITSNPSDKGRHGTMDWLTRHEIMYDELHFCTNKLVVDFSAILEDHPHTAYAAASLGRAAFLVQRPWTHDPMKHPNLFALPEDAAAGDVVMDILTARECR